MNYLDYNLIFKIIKYIDLDQKKYIKKYIFNQLSVFSKLININSIFYKKYIEKYSKLKKIYYLINKYYKLHNRYENEIEYYSSTPILYDALSTSLVLPYVNSSYQLNNIGDLKIFYQDIYDIIKYIPESLNYNDGNLRCRYKVTPLYIACLNSFIPINIIERLMKKSNIFYIFVNGHKVNMLTDLYQNISQIRYEKISNIFKLNMT